MLPVIQIQQANKDWSPLLRPKPLTVVQYRNKYWCSASGINSEPVEGNPDWMFVCEAEPYYKNLKISKNLNNTGKGLEATDFVSGQRSSSMYWVFAMFLGGDKDNDDNFEVVSEQPL